MNRTLNIGTQHDSHTNRDVPYVVTIHIAAKDDGDVRVTLQGEGRDGGGQHSEPLIADDMEWTPGWTAELARDLYDVWNRWHLNDMRPGSPNQMRHLREYPPECNYPDTHYDAALRSLTEVGLQPDPTYLHNGERYSYGSAWLYEEVPSHIIAKLVNYPNGRKADEAT